MSEIRILSIDPALRNTGFALGRLFLPSEEITIDDIHLLTTDAQKATGARQSSDDLRRAQEIVDAINCFSKDVDFVFAEIPSGSKSSRGSMSNGVIIGILASLKKPLIQVTPRETKVASVANPYASKEQIMKWAYENWPTLPWLTYKRAGKLLKSNSNEHLADSCAILYAGLKTPEFQAVLAVYKAASR